MKYFLDSGKIDEIRYAYDNYKIDGVTTNPKHIMDSGKPFLTVINELAEEFRGKDSFEHPFTEKGLKIFSNAWDQTEGN